MSVGERVWHVLKPRQEIKDKIPYWEVLGGRHCVELRVCLLSFLFSFFSFFFFLESMNVLLFFLYFYRIFLLGSLTSSSGKYIHIPRGLDRIFISISISYAATVLLLLLVTSFSSSSSSTTLLLSSSE